MNTTSILHSDKYCMAIILAAGKGTRMKGETPKVMRKLLGEPMLGWVISALAPIFGDQMLAVFGHKANLVKKAFPYVDSVRQAPQLGTGHALQTAISALSDKWQNYLVINGDAPLVTTPIIERFLQESHGSDLSFATITLPDPGSYGRVIRDCQNKVIAIVEARDLKSYLDKMGGSQNCANANEVNAGLYFISTKVIEKLLPQLNNQNNSGEYYITDLIDLAVKNNMDCRGISCGNDPGLSGVNSPLELANAENILSKRINDGLMQAGVILHNPDLVRCGPLALIDPGCEITGPCEIYGETIIAGETVIESHCVIINSKIMPKAHIKSFCHIENAIVGPAAQAGPYCRLRPKAFLGENAHAGNFVELKNAVLGKDSKANHLTYLGDAEIGSGVNIGAGTITCNYDGARKHKTVIGDNAFIGSNTAIVAPLEIGGNTLVGAGSTLTRNVPDNEMAIARSRQVNMPKPAAHNKK